MLRDLVFSAEESSLNNVFRYHFELPPPRYLCLSLNLDYITIT